MPASLFLLRGHLCKDNTATVAKTGMIWVGGSSPKQTILAGKTKGGKSLRNSGKGKMVEME